MKVRVLNYSVTTEPSLPDWAGVIKPKDFTVSVKSEHELADVISGYVEIDHSDWDGAIIVDEIDFEVVEEDLQPAKYARTCSQCGKGMNDGYCIEGGMEYYCSEDCLHEHYTEEEYLEMYADGEGDSYWTEWNPEDEDN